MGQEDDLLLINFMTGAPGILLVLNKKKVIEYLKSLYKRFLEYARSTCSEHDG